MHACCGLAIFDAPWIDALTTVIAHVPDGAPQHSSVTGPGASEVLLGAMDEHCTCRINDLPLKHLEVADAHASPGCLTAHVTARPAETMRDRKGAPRRPFVTAAVLAFHAFEQIVELRFGSGEHDLYKSNRHAILPVSYVQTKSLINACEYLQTQGPAFTDPGVL